MGHGAHPYELRTKMAEAGICTFQFETNNTSDPDGLVDYSATATGQGIVSTSTAISRSDTGDFLVTLRDVWKYVVPISAVVAEDSVYHADVHTITQGVSAANTFYVTVKDGSNSDAPVDTTDHTVVVTLLLIR